jgi:hypothetical protein
VGAARIGAIATEGTILRTTFEGMLDVDAVSVLRCRGKKIGANDTFSEREKIY